MTNPRVFGGLVLSIALLACAAQAGAAEADGKSIRDAKERYARGLHLFENGDNSGALVQFERAHELRWRPWTISCPTRARSSPSILLAPRLPRRSSNAVSDSSRSK
jgi:hypothetical protein